MNSCKVGPLSLSRELTFSEARVSEGRDQVHSPSERHDD